MRCPACQTENRGDALYCDECGGALEVACPACGCNNRPAAKFCRRCRAALDEKAASGKPEQRPSPRGHEDHGERRRPDAPTREERNLSPSSPTPRHLADKILHSRSAVQGERKQVTVLFADVKGSMDLAEKMSDPGTARRGRPRGSSRTPAGWSPRAPGGAR